MSAEADIEIVWRAFELRPYPVPTLDPNGDYLQNAWKNSVLPLAEKLGVTMKLPPVQPRSRLAHEAAHWARSVGRFDDMHKAIFRAIFERGEDIGEIDVLLSIADSLDLDKNALRVALINHEFLDNVVEDEYEAEMLGVNGVPAFVADQKAALSGVQPVESLKRLIEIARDRA